MRKYLRFSLRTFLLLVTLVAVWLVINLHRYRQRNAAIDAIRQSGGTISYADPKRSNSFNPAFERRNPRWLGPIFGVHSLQKIGMVEMDAKHGEAIAQLKYLGPLNGLFLRAESCDPEVFRPLEELKVTEVGFSGSGITDFTMGYISRMEGIRTVKIADASITDGVWKHLAMIDSLSQLSVIECDVTGQGAGSLNGITGLRFHYCSVDDAGVHEISKISTLCVLDLSGNPISDAGVKHLKDLNGLCVLDLSDSYVGDPGIANLVTLKDLQELQIHATNVTDLGTQTIADLRSLRVVDIRSTSISDDGLLHLHKASSLEFLLTGPSAESAPLFGRLKETIRYGKIQISPITQEGMKKFCEAVPGCTVR